MIRGGTKKVVVLQQTFEGAACRIEMSERRVAIRPEAVAGSSSKPTLINQLDTSNTFIVLIIDDDDTDKQPFMTSQ